MIVKFSDGSDAGRLMAPIVAGKQSIDAAAPLAAHLSKELGAPLSAVRVTSGRELLLAIDREQLGRILAERATREPAVERVTPAEATNTLLPAEQLAFVVELKRDSETQRQVAQDVARGETSSPRVEQVIKGLAGDLRPQMSARVDERGRLMLVLDVAALTREVVERLQRLPDVDYAQANLVLKPFNQPP